MHIYPIWFDLYCLAVPSMVPSPVTTVPADRDVLPMDCDGFNPYHNPNEVRKFNIQRDQLLMDEVELGSGNFGCVKKGVFKTDS